MKIKNVGNTNLSYYDTCDSVTLELLPNTEYTVCETTFNYLITFYWEDISTNELIKFEEVVE